MEEDMKKILIVLAILLAGGFLCLAQSLRGNGQVKGVVTDSVTNQPIEGVTIKLFYVKSKGYLTPYQTTDAEGKWKALFIRGGLWYLDLEKIGYETKKISINIIDLPGTKTPVVTTSLVKLQGPTMSTTVKDDILSIREKYVSKGKFSKAIDAFKSILEKFPETNGIGIINLYIGDAYASLQKFKEAIEYYKKALLKYPKHKGIQNSIGESFMNLKQQDQAIKYFSRLSTEDIRNPDSLYNIGVYYYNKFNYNKAEKFFKATLSKNEKYASAVYQLGMTYVALSKEKLALTYLKKYLLLEPKSQNASIAQSVIDAYKDQ
jgi:tetratricopeptide (TPR) repeat protein